MTGDGIALVDGVLTHGVLTHTVLGQWRDAFEGSPDVWAAIVVIGVATYGFRLSFIHLFGRIDEVPPSVKRTLRYVPPAVLAALVFPDFVTLESSVVATLADERLIAGAAAGAVAWRTENVFATITVGMIALWLFRFVVFA